MSAATTVVIPTTTDNVILKIQGREVRLTNLRKMFWPERLSFRQQCFIFFFDSLNLKL